MIDRATTISGLCTRADGSCEPVRLAATPTTQRSGWSVLLWAALAALLELALRIPEVIVLPDAVRPFVPLLAGIVRYVLAIARGRASWTEVAR